MDLFHFDFEAMTFYVGDSKVELSKTEQKLLRLLVENRGRTMTRGDLVDRIWTMAQNMWMKMLCLLRSSV